METKELLKNKRPLGHSDWETIIRNTKIRVRPVHKTITPQISFTGEVDLVCDKLKSDLEWYCNLPEKNRSKVMLRNILDNSPPPDPSSGIIEKWWLLT